ncbi:hypothetical protein FRACA_3290002 [Frankia canadensis]|uniref:Uncharacterized protein n=1 Tax=Frankia canadensis TaxID=1836972 RepID=A0A2I2KUQ6_9ACTN|nr:hypothetical protein FRACA_3290002 [Frankia canadensis]SOU56683.1 hypothetical protein FRACA_3290002 [Frankia canadensis]
MRYRPDRAGKIRPGAQPPGSFHRNGQPVGDARGRPQIIARHTAMLREAVAPDLPFDHSELGPPPALNVFPEVFPSGWSTGRGRGGGVPCRLTDRICRWPRPVTVWRNPPRPPALQGDRCWPSGRFSVPWRAP